MELNLTLLRRSSAKSNNLYTICILQLFNLRHFDIIPLLETMALYWYMLVSLSETDQVYTLKSNDQFPAVQ